MKTEALANRLKKELIRSPVKSGVLGVCTLVAVWFWAPLIGRWLGGDADETLEAAAVVEPANSEMPSLEAVAAPNSRRDAAIRWDAVVEARQRDERAKSAGVDPVVANPFAKRWTPAEPEPPPEAALPAAPAEPEPSVVLTPEEIGIQFTGVFIGDAGRVAMMGGRKVRERDVIAFGDPTSDSPRCEFEVIHIASDHVLLRGEGKTHRLAIRKTSPRVSDGVSIRFQSKPDGRDGAEG